MTAKKLFKIRYNERHSLFLSTGLILLLAVLNTQCIEEYDPKLNVDVNLLTVNGSIVRGQEEQTVVITRSTPVDDTQYKAVENCSVFVSDDRNNQFIFKEVSPGEYTAKIDITYLAIGAKFKLSINTPDNKVYESDYQEIQDCPPVDNLYFQEEINYSTSLNQDLNGLRLNLDLPVREEYTEYYRWKINETWQYRSINQWIEKELIGVETDSISGEVVILYKYFNKPDSLHNCWHKAIVKDLFSASTLNMEINGKKRVPLHFIFGNNERLFVRYSCLVSQFSLNKGAYDYWHNKEVEISESGGIYFSQPSQTISNIRNINNDQETVLGYFWASSVKEKRVFFEGPPFKIDHIIPCQKDTFNIENYFKGPDNFGEFVRINPSRFPVYLDFIISDNGSKMLTTSDKSCFDCRIRGGTINEPDYW